MKTLLKTVLALALLLGTATTFASQTTNWVPIPHCYPCDDGVR